MKILFSLLAVCSLLLGSCLKSDNCDCDPPPGVTAHEWKITQRNGSISGTPATLTDDQKNSVLHLSPDGSFKVTNAATSMEVSGTYKTSDFNSIYGDMQRIVFTPNLPMLSNEYHILVDNQNGKFVLGDNLADGYLTTFTIQ